MSSPLAREKTFGSSHTDTLAKKYRNYLPFDVTTCGPTHQAFLGPGTNTTELRHFLRDLVHRRGPRLSMIVEDNALNTHEMLNIEQSIPQSITTFELRVIDNRTEFQYSLVKMGTRQTADPSIYYFSQCSFNPRHLDEPTTVQICGFTNLQGLAIVSLDHNDILLEADRRFATLENLLQILQYHHHTLTTFHMTLDLLDDIECIFAYLKYIPTLSDLVLGKAGQIELRRGLTLASQQQMTRAFKGFYQLVSLSLPIETIYPELIDVLTTFPTLENLVIPSFCNHLVGTSLLKILAKSGVIPAFHFSGLKVLDVGIQASDEATFQQVQYWFVYPIIR